MCQISAVKVAVELVLKAENDVSVLVVLDFQRENGGVSEIICHPSLPACKATAQ